MISGAELQWIKHENVAVFWSKGKWPLLAQPPSLLRLHPGVLLPTLLTQDGKKAERMYIYPYYYTYGEFLKFLV